MKTPQFKKPFYKAMEKIEVNFPNLDPEKLDEIIVGTNKSGGVTVELVARKNAVPHTLFDDEGVMNDSIPQKIKDILGKQSFKRLIEELEDSKGKEKKLKKKLEESTKEKEELIKSKDDELKTKDDVIKEKEKEIIRIKELKELIKSKDDELKTKDGIIKSKHEIIKTKDDEIETKDIDLENKVRSGKLLEQMSARDMEEAKKEIEKITNEFNLERDKKIKAEKNLEMERQNLVQSQKKISLLERKRVKMEHDIKEIKESGGNYNQKLVIEKEELFKKMEESEQLTRDMADMTQEKIKKASVEVEEANRSEAAAIAHLDMLSKRLVVLENRNEEEVANARREINKLTSERNNAQRSLEVMKDAAGNITADLEREIQRLTKQINDLEQEKVANEERFRVFKEQSEQEKQRI